MDRVFQRIIHNHFSELKGTVIEASVPVSQSLINELIQLSLQESKNIESIQVTVHPENRVSAAVKTTVLPWPLNLRLKLDRSVDFASYSSPKIRAWMENNRLLGSVGAFLNMLPEGVKVYGDQIVVDLGTWLPTPEQRKYLDLVKFVGIDTGEGQVNLHVRVEIAHQDSEKQPA
jgi:hypothetical protein